MPADRRFESTVSGASTSTTRNTTSTSKRESGSAVDPSDPLACYICGTLLGRKKDLERHLKIHDDSEESKLPCTVEGCEYRTLQKKNLETHILRHYSEKKYKCKDDLLNCTFKSCDPAALLRHRKTFHGYIPRRRRKPVPAPGPQPPAVPSRHRKTRRRVPVVVPAPTDRVSSSTILSPNSDSFPFGEMTSESSLGLQVPPMSSESSPHFPLPPGSLPPCQWDGGFWVQRNAPVSYDCQWHGFGPANPTTSHGSGHQFEHNTAEFHWQLPTYSHLPLDTWSPSPFFDYSAEWHQTPSQSQSQLQHGW